MLTFILFQYRIGNRHWPISAISNWLSEYWLKSLVGATLHVALYTLELNTHIVDHVTCMSCTSHYVHTYVYIHSLGCMCTDHKVKAAYKLRNLYQ